MGWVRCWFGKGVEEVAEVASVAVCVGDITIAFSEAYVQPFVLFGWASAAYMSVKKDLSGANLSGLGADEVAALFDAAQKKP